jgi:tyrosine-protein kinase Etk/Wzc
MMTKSQPSFVDYLTIIAKYRRFIAKTIVLVTGVAIIISLLIPNQFTASATILPPNTQQDMMMGLLSANISANIGGLTGLGRLMPGATTPSDLYAAILSSERIMYRVIEKYDLKKVLKCRTIDETFKALKQISRITVTPEGIVSVSVTWYDKWLATDIANSFIEELDIFNTQTAMTTGKKYRMFVEGRLMANRDTLALAEKALRNFQEQNRTVALDEEIQAAISTIAQLKSQIILSEVQRGAWASSGNVNNPMIIKIDQELNEMKKQLREIEFGQKDTPNGFGAGFSVPFAELPEVALEYARLLRDVKVQEAIFELLTQQYEQAKIMELKDTPTVQFLDRASPPEKKSTPKRSRIAIFAAFSSLILAILASLIIESFEKMKQKPTEYKKWVSLRDKIISDTASISEWIKAHLGSSRRHSI